MKRLSPTQQKMVDHLRASPSGKMVRVDGGFWVAYEDVDAVLRRVFGIKAPWCDIRTVRALEKAGVLRRTNEFLEEWRDTRSLVPMTVRGE